MPERERLLASVQQPERLVAAATDAGLQHGTETLVDIDNVAVYPAPENTPADKKHDVVLAQMRFCNSLVSPRRLLGGEPTQQEISDEVFLIGGLRVPHIKAGKSKRLYSLKNVILSSNGRTELRVTKQTRFVRTDHHVVNTQPIGIELVATD